MHHHVASTCCCCRPGQAAAEAEGATQPLTAPPQPASQQGFKTFNERDFVLEVPQGFSEYQDPQKAAEATEFGTGGRPKSTYGAHLISDVMHQLTRQFF